MTEPDSETDAETEGVSFDLQRSSTGCFTSNTREQVREAVPEDGEPVISSEIAQEVGVSKSSANYHLNNLADNGRVQKKKFHEKRVVWWRE